MDHEFTAYIDEAGDQGFIFRDERRISSSHWFILSAIVVRRSRETDIKKAIASLRDELKLRREQVLHFQKLNHQQPVLVCHCIAKMPVPAISVIVEKQNLAQREIFSGSGFRLYFFTARLLLERLSWLCRDQPPRGRCRLVFERCKGLQYGALEAYVQRLKMLGHDPDYPQKINIEWEWLLTHRLHVVDKRDFNEVQLADACASAYGWALEEKFRHTEHRFAKTLKPVMYSRGNKYLSYGVKFLTEPPNLHWINKYYR